jgi:hypothetical protein
MPMFYELLQGFCLLLVLLALRDALRVHAAGIQQSKRAVRFHWFTSQPVNKTTPNHNRKSHPMLEVTLTNEQKIRIGLTPVTDAGRQRRFDVHGKRGRQLLPRLRRSAGRHAVPHLGGCGPRCWCRNHQRHDQAHGPWREGEEPRAVHRHARAEGPADGLTITHAPP